MKSVYFIRTRDNRPYILVTVSAGSTDFQPLSEDADDVTNALDEAYKNKPIKKNELDGALDDDLSIEGPLQVNRETRTRIASFLEEANIPQYESGTKPPAMISKTVYSSDVADRVIDDFPSEIRHNIIEYKALAFIADQTKTTFNYEVKRVRALWDPNLAIPGTNRRGGWRCPVGTRYGGQITDRFGRNCGWGVARRIANAITNIGERLENIDDGRRGRRVNRRNERMASRLRRDAGAGGRVERGLRGIAERLEGDGVAEPTTGGRRRGRLAQVFGEDGPLRVGPVRRVAPQRQQEIDVPEDRETPPRPPRRRRPNLRESEQRRMEREVREPGAPRTEEPPRPPRQPRRRGAAAERVDETASDIGDAPRAGERYDDYVNRKYAEYENRVQEIQRRGGRAGLLTRDEWYKFNRNNLREAWGRANGGEVPDERNVAPRPERRPQPRAPRRRRVNASDAQAGQGANRRPRPADQPIPQQRPAARPTRVVPEAPPAPPAPPQPPDLGGSLPDARSERNVYNRFRQNGLPDTAYWREPDFPEGEEKAELERRFGRYYDNNNQRNARGDYVNRMIQERNRGAAAPNQRQAPPEPPARRLPSQPPQPPPAEEPLPEPQTPVRKTRRRRGADGDKIKASDLRSVNTGIHGHGNKRFEQNMGHTVVDGVLVPKHVASGNVGINNATDAKNHLANGGSLDDVPDLLVKDAIFDNAAMPGTPVNGKRFQLLGDPGNGINNRGAASDRHKTYLVVDQVTGKRYIIKSPSFVEDEAVGEQLAALIGQLSGRPMARVRIIGAREERVNRERNRRNMNHSILVEHFGDVHGMDVTEGRNAPNSPDRQASKHVKFIDEILGNPDRHINNYMWAGNQKLPIDHGIMAGGRGIVPQRSLDDARRILERVDSAAIRQNFRNLSDATIANVVTEMVRYWRAIGMPQDRIRANRDNIQATLRNIAQASRE